MLAGFSKTSKKGDPLQHIQNPRIDLNPKHLNTF